MNETRAASRPTPGTASCLKPVTAALAGVGFVAMLLAPAPFAVAAEATLSVVAREMDRDPWRIAQAAPAASVNDSAAIGLRPLLAQAKATSTFTVTNTNATGAGSLSDAISQANSFGCYGNDSVIAFAIAGPGPHVITTNTGFSIGCPTVINGYSQPGSSANTVADARNGSNAAPQIVIDGSSMTGGNLLTIGSGATGSTVRGLVLRNGAPSGSAIYNFASSVLIGGNFIGTDQTGAACGSVSGPGIQLDFNATGAMVGSAAAGDRNVIGCAFPAIAINGTTNIQVKGNLIGVGPDGLQPVPNSHGITTSNTFMSVAVGGQGLGEGNVIAHNTGSGVTLFSNTSGIVVSGNDIFLNGLLGIDQGGDGVPMTPNTFTFPSGSNGGQNYPAIASVTYAGGNTTIAGTLHGFWNSNNVLEYFSNDGTLGLDEGSRYAGTSGVSIVSTTPVPFTATIPGIVRNPTATATASSGTSEFSPAFLTPDMTPSTTTVTFPATALGAASSPIALSIQNSGLGSLTIDSISNPGFAEFFDTTGGPPPSSAHYCGVGSDSAGAPLSGSSISISPSGSCVLNLAFRPQASGARSTTLTFNDSGSPNSAVTVTLAGTGGTLLPLPTVVSFSPTSLTLPGPVPAFSTLGINVANTNGAPAQGLSFTQSLPANLVIASTPNAGILGASCSGSFLSVIPGASSFTVDSLFVPTSGACDVLIDVTSNTAGSYPVTVAAGAITGTVLSQAVTNALSNTGTLAVNAASLLLSPPSPVNFGTVFLGSSAPVAVTLTNTGSAPLNFSAPFAVTGANAADFTFTDTCVPDPNPQLAPGASCTVNITFTPGAIGARAASMSFPSNTLTSPDVLSLTGTGSAVPVPVVSLSPTSMFFPAQTVGTTSSPQVATLTNIGTAPLNISSIMSTGDFAQSSTCGTSLTPSSACTISVTFTPLITGLRTGDVKIVDDASGSPHAILLDGDGVAPPVPTVTVPSSVSFPTTQVGGSTSATDITIVNSGGAPLVISLAEIVGAGFSKVSDGCSGATITPSSSCVVSIVFAPTTSGAITATLRILSNAPTSPNFVGLTGQATVAPVASLSASPPSLVFAEQVVNTTSPAQTVTLANTGGVAATVSGVTVTGDFAQTNNCSTVNAGESCAITVTFTPSGTGSRPGSIVVAGNASNAPVTIALSGSAAPPPLPVIELSVTSLTYGNTLTGAGSGTQSVTLRNVGGSPLTIASLRRTGEFTVSNGCPAVVPAGGSCRIDVGFVPTIPGPRTGRLDVLSDASNGTKGVDLGGTGCRFSFLNRNYTLLCQ